MQEATTSPHFLDNPAIKGREGHYLSVTVDSAKVLKSWRESLFSFEWLTKDGKIKEPSDLAPADQERRAAVEEKIRKNAPLERPVLGIGLLENVEIGSGKAVFLTLTAQGIRHIPVHIPVSNKQEFAGFIVS